MLSGKGLTDYVCIDAAKMFDQYINAFVIRICSTLSPKIRTLCHYKDKAGRPSVLIDMPCALLHIEAHSKACQEGLLQKVTEAMGSFLLKRRTLIMGFIEGMHCQVAKVKRIVTSLRFQAKFFEESSAEDEHTEAAPRAHHVLKPADYVRKRPDCLV